MDSEKISGVEPTINSSTNNESEFMDFREKTRKDRKTVYIFKVLDSLLSKQNLKLTKIN